MNKRKLTKMSTGVSSKVKKASLRVSQRVSTSTPAVKLGKEAVKWTLLIFTAFLVLFPFYYMISMSLMSYDEINHSDLAHAGSDVPVFFPVKLMWNNFKIAWEDGYFNAFMLSAAVVVVNIVFKLFVCILFGYAFGNYNFKCKKAMWSIFMLTLMVPEVALLSGQYKVVLHYNLNQGLMMLLTLSGPFIASVFTGYMFRNAFEAIPESVKEAALMDGIGGFRYFMFIALPMVKGTTWTVVILTTFASWNAYMWPSLVLGAEQFANGDAMQTIPMWLLQLGDNDAGMVQIQIRMAGSVFAVIPTLLFYLIFKNKIDNAVTGDSANKG